jgi:hypothetical protein
VDPDLEEEKVENKKNVPVEIGLPIITGTDKKVTYYRAIF